MNRLIPLAFLTLAFPAAAAAQGAQSPIPGTPNLAVASVKMESGFRASKLIGAAVFNGANEQVGTVDDLILDKQDKVSLTVISVGGFLGVGGKLVAVPFASLKMDGAGKVMLPEGSKDALNKMPSFTYGG